MSTEPLNVLVVDDNAEFARSLGQLLEALGCGVVLASDASTALLRALEQRPQVIFLDLQLGQDNGSHVMSALRQMFPEEEQPAIVCLTGYGTPQIELQCRKAGFDLFLMKPVSTALLREVLSASRIRLNAGLRAGIAQG